MKDEWKTFIDKLKIPAEFLHRDEFLRKLKSHPHNIGDVKFPEVFPRMNEVIKKRKKGYEGDLLQIVRAYISPSISRLNRT